MIPHPDGKFLIQYPRRFERRVMGEDREVLGWIATIADVRDIEVLEMADAHVSVTGQLSIDEHGDVDTGVFRAVDEVINLYQGARCGDQRTVDWCRHGLEVEAISRVWVFTRPRVQLAIAEIHATAMWLLQVFYTDTDMYRVADRQELLKRFGCSEGALDTEGATRVIDEGDNGVEQIESAEGAPDTRGTTRETIEGVDGGDGGAWRRPRPTWLEHSYWSAGGTRSQRGEKGIPSSDSDSAGGQVGGGVPTEVCWRFTSVGVSNFGLESCM